MNRPRIAAIISGVAASTAAFLVTSRWNLAGTLAGAALFPVIYIMVSHSSAQGFESLDRWMRRRRGVDGDEAEASVPEPLPGWHSRNQWVLTGLACLALGVSVYGLVASDAAGTTTVVRERVIETITVTVQPPTSANEDEETATDRTTTTRRSPAPTTTSTTVTETTAPADTSITEPPSTTATSEPPGGPSPDASPSTTGATLGSS